ncbi:MAG: hypothetical protein QM737_05480 [Ferruginibacter sp.]
MKLKIYITAFISILLVSFPANILGCGGESDPYDYYISFFHQDLPDAKGFQPFYYTSYSFLYDTREPASVTDALSQEWAAYCGSPVTKVDAEDFVFNYPVKYIDSLYEFIKNKKRSKKADPLKENLEENSMSAYFLKRRTWKRLNTSAMLSM